LSSRGSLRYQREGGDNRHRAQGRAKMSLNIPILHRDKSVGGKFQKGEKGKSVLLTENEKGGNHRVKTFEKKKEKNRILHK